MNDWLARRRTAVVAAALVLLTLAIYLPVVGFNFINYDDEVYVAKNPMVAAGLTGDGFVWAFTHSCASNWHPLTWLSHMLDCQLFGLQPGWPHLVNVLWHAANSVLVLLVLQRLTGALWRSAFVAALFALHPLHVESVAWIAERKDVLSTFFGLLTLLCYARYAKKTLNSDKSRAGIQPSTSNARWYWLSLFCFAFSLLSKPMWVTLPCLLLLLDYWPLGRFTIYDLRFTTRRLLVEKIPFFALTIASCAVTFFVQRSWGSVMSAEDLPLTHRVENALISYGTYLGKAFWPTDLSIIRPLVLEPPAWQLPVAAVVLASITIWALWNRRRPWLLVGWLFFLGTLLPVIGLVQVGNQAWADRYTYLPLLGIFIAVTWQITDWWSVTTGNKSSTVTVTVAGIVVGAVILSALTLATSRQLQYWRNSHALFTHALEVIPDNPFAHNGLGLALLDEGKTDDARAQFTEALRINPEYADAMAGLGVALARSGDVAEAIGWEQRATRINPRLARTCGELAAWLAARGEYAGAIACYRQILHVVPDAPDWLNDLAWLLASCPDAKFRDGAEAVRLATHACEVTGYREPMLIGTLAAAQAEAGNFEKAISTAAQAAQKAEAAGQTTVAQRNRELIELYRSGRAYRQPPVTTVGNR